jgi:hypothetical protein
MSTSATAAPRNHTYYHRAAISIKVFTLHLVAAADAQLLQQAQPPNLTMHGGR